MSSFKDKVEKRGGAMATLNRISGRDTAELIAISKIRMDGGTQPRAALDEETIREYAEEMQKGVIFPPVDLFYDGTDYWLADGFHRVNGAKRAGFKDIKADVHQGDKRAAVLHSVGVNADHGLRRTNEDKRRAVMVLLSDTEWGTWSNSEIGRQCKVSDMTVKRLRDALSSTMLKIDSPVHEETPAQQDHVEPASMPESLPETPYDHILAVAHASQLATRVQSAINTGKLRVDELDAVIAAEESGRNRQNFLGLLRSYKDSYTKQRQQLAKKAGVSEEVVAQAQENVIKQQASGTRTVQRGGKAYEQSASSDKRSVAQKERQAKPRTMPQPAVPEPAAPKEAQDGNSEFVTAYTRKLDGRMSLERFFKEALELFGDDCWLDASISVMRRNKEQ